MSESEERSKNEKNPLFHELSAEGSESESTIIESLCMNCGKNVSLLFVLLMKYENKSSTLDTARSLLLTFIN